MADEVSPTGNRITHGGGDVIVLRRQLNVSLRLAIRALQAQGVLVVELLREAEEANALVTQLTQVTQQIAALDDTAIEQL